MKRLSLFAVMAFFVCAGAFAQGPSLTGTVTSTGFDFNNNGLFDYLELTVGIQNAGAFYYYCSVDFTDKNGTMLGQQTNILVPILGGTGFNLFFDGSVIGRNGVDGPYYLRNLTLKDLSGNVVLAATVPLATEALRADQFEGFTGPSDTTPPTVVVTATPSVLWPADHKMHEIQVDVTATDDTDPNPVITMLSITSNQGENMTGDGNTSPDIMVKDGHIFLRAERNAHQTDDRIYMITYTATDAAGNVGTAFAEVTVPHDQRNH